MATFQDVRGFFEAQAMTALKTAGIDDDLIFFDNVGETPGRADQSYAVVSLSFTDTVRDTISCEGIEDLRGSIQVNCYTPKNKGSKGGEDICAEVMKNWQAINRYRPAADALIRQACIRNVEGPFTLAPDPRPHAVHVCNANWMARADDTTTRGLTTKQVVLTNPTREQTALTKEVSLTHPVSGLTTQEDANHNFDDRLKLLESGGGTVDPDLIARLLKLEGEHDADGGHDSGSYDTTKSKRSKKAKADPLLSGKPLGTKEIDDEFAKRLERLEQKHDANAGHDSGDY